MNSQYFCSFRSMFSGVLMVVALLASTPCMADEANDTLDSILNAPPMPAVNVYQSESVQNDVFAQANELASQVANMYRDLRHQAYPAAPDASDIKVVCTVTVRDRKSDDELSTIKTAPRISSGSPHKLPVPLSQISPKLVSMISKLAEDATPLLKDPQNESIEVMVQIKRNGTSQATVAVSVDALKGGFKTGVSFYSKEDALPNVTDVGYPANNDQSK